MPNFIHEKVLNIAWEAVETANEAFDAIQDASSMLDGDGTGFVPEEIATSGLAMLIDAQIAFNLSCDMAGAVTISEHNLFLQ